MYLCIWQTLLFKATYAAFQGTHLHYYQSMHSTGNRTHDPGVASTNAVLFELQESVMNMIIDAI